MASNIVITLSNGCHLPEVNNTQVIIREKKTPLYSN